ncbi:DUF5132 domain-containing protein [Amycolatopsis orientalis]|nr:DUF5132 domain-containing protein [Amycolatopsis orientalis]
MVLINQENTEHEDGCEMLPPLPAFLIGLVIAPLAGKMVKPLARGAVRASVGVALEVRKIAAQAGEELQDLAAEVRDAEQAEKKRTAP